MSTDAMEPSRLSPLIEADSAWGWAKGLLFVSVLVALAAFGALKGPELMHRLSGGATPPLPAAPATAEVKPPPPPVVAAERAAPPEAPGVEAAPATPEAETAPAQVELSFDVEPADAVVFVAGDPVEGSVRVARSQTGIHVEVSAPGYHSQDRLVVPDQDRRVRFQLEKQAAPPDERASPRRKKRGR